MNGRLMSVSITDDSSIFAFSAASLRRWSAMRSFVRSMPSLFLNSDAIQSMTFWSRLSPPRCVSPLVDLTSTTPSPTSRNRDVERAAAEVVYRDRLVFFLVEPVGERRGRRAR
jgi:hypothetical protein